jgi:Flp pilus assembly protein TadD
MTTTGITLRFADAEPTLPSPISAEEQSLRCLETAAAHLGGDRPDLVESALETEAILQSTDPKIQRAAGNLLLKAGHTNLARAKFLLTTRLDPACAEAHVDLGVVWLLQNQVELAEASLRKALELDPRLPDAWKAVGHLQFRRRDPEAGVESFRRALELSPDDPECLVLLGGWLARQGQGLMARNLLERAARLRPDDPGIRAELDKIRL